MTCRDRLKQLGVDVLEVDPTGAEFVCRADDSGAGCEALESLDFWDYTSPLELFELRPRWWSPEIDVTDERIFLVMGDPDQPV